MYFQDVSFLFDNIKMLCFKGLVFVFFLHKNICVNSTLTALTSHLGLKASSLVPTQQQWPRPGVGKLVDSRATMGS